MGREDGSLGEGPVSGDGREQLHDIFWRKRSRTLLYMEKEGNKGTKDAPYDIGLISRMNGSIFY